MERNVYVVHVLTRKSSALLSTEVILLLYLKRTSASYSCSEIFGMV